MIISASSSPPPCPIQINVEGAPPAAFGSPAEGGLPGYSGTAPPSPGPAGDRTISDREAMVRFARSSHHPDRGIVGCLAHAKTIGPTPAASDLRSRANARNGTGPFQRRRSSGFDRDRKITTARNDYLWPKPIWRRSKWAVRGLTKSARRADRSGASRHATARTAPRRPPACRRAAPSAAEAGRSAS